MGYSGRHSGILAQRHVHACMCARIYVRNTRAVHHTTYRLSTYLPTYDLPTYVGKRSANYKYIHIIYLNYLPAYLPTYIPTYVRTYIHTCINTYGKTHRQAGRQAHRKAARPESLAGRRVYPGLATTRTVTSESKVYG